MKAVVIEAPGKTQIKEVKIPEPEEDEVLFKMEGCGICASNLPVWEGREWFDYPQEPGAPGHEGYGTIIQTGKNVKHLKIGQRIAAMSFKAYAEYDVVKEDQAVVIPEELKILHFPGEPLGCAMNIFRRSDIRKGHKVAIIGAGFLGALLIQLAKKEGAEVMAISKRPYSLEVADEMGADITLSLNDDKKIMQKAKEFTNEDLFDRVIEATGKQKPLTLAGKIIGENGKIIVAGFHQDGPRSVDMQSWNWKGIDVINAHERKPERYIEGIKDALQSIRENNLSYTPLLTHFFYPEEMDVAFQMLANRPDGFIKGILKF